jgi:hypothetical protein
MGFNKRFVKFDNILYRLNSNEPLSSYFSADALLFTDKESKIIFDLHEKGVTDSEILKLINNGTIFKN